MLIYFFTKLITTFITGKKKLKHLNVYSSSLNHIELDSKQNKNQIETRKISTRCLIFFGAFFACTFY